MNNEMIELANEKKLDIDNSKEELLDDKNEYEKVKYLAHFALKFEQYEDALFYVDKMIQEKQGELTEDERDLFVSAYRIFINEKRTAWRNIYISEVKEKEDKTKYIPIMNEIRIQYEDIIIKACEKLIYCINTYIIKKTASLEGKAFFLKVKADHFRYLAEISTGQNLRKYIENSLQFYNESYIISKSLKPLDNIRLGIALNYSVFHYEVLNNSIKALEYATETLSTALEELNSYSASELENDKTKDSFVIIQMIKDNIHQWYTEMETEMKRK
jgi:14-3-3 protein epsilon